jgi:hypothetical protein
LSGRLMPYYQIYENIANLIDQCDKMSAELNPVIPMSQIYNAPCKTLFVYSKQEAILILFC